MRAESSIVSMGTRSEAVEDRGAGQQAADVDEAGMAKARRRGGCQLLDAIVCRESITDRWPGSRVRWMRKGLVGRVRVPGHASSIPGARGAERRSSGSAMPPSTSGERVISRIITNDRRDMVFGMSMMPMLGIH